MLPVPAEDNEGWLPDVPEREASHNDLQELAPSKADVPEQGPGSTSGPVEVLQQASLGNLAPSAHLPCSLKEQLGLTQVTDGKGELLIYVKLLVGGGLDLEVGQTLTTLCNPPEVEGDEVQESSQTLTSPCALSKVPKHSSLWIL
ncbi:UNVERIFIED_CONTAM: hypothetical protein K2H54_042421 [Gekko kuhli]